MPSNTERERPCQRVKPFAANKVAVSEAMFSEPLDVDERDSFKDLQDQRLFMSQLPWMAYNPGVCHGGEFLGPSKGPAQ